MVRFSPHIALDVRNKEAAVEFYRRALGMDLIEESDDETVLESGDISFHLQEAESPTVHLEFAVDDLDRTIEECTERGCRISETTIPEGDASFLVEDPFGTHYHLYEGDEEIGTKADG